MSKSEKCMPFWQCDSCEYCCDDWENDERKCLNEDKAHPCPGLIEENQNDMDARICTLEKKMEILEKAILAMKSV